MSQLVLIIADVIVRGVKLLSISGFAVIFALPLAVFPSPAAENALFVSYQAIAIVQNA